MNRLALRILALLLLLPTAGWADARPDPRGRSAVPLLEASLPPDQQAELRFLQHLGWRFVLDPGVARVEVHAGRPCYRRTLEVAQEAGDLVVRIPASAEAKALRAFGETLASLSDARASRCAWQQRVHVATWAATHKLAALAARRLFQFPEILVIDSPWYKFRPPVPEWEGVGRRHLPADSPARAIESIYERGGVAECYAAQILATFAIQYELYGPERFDEAFTREEIVVGPTMEVGKTPFGRFAEGAEGHRWRALVIPANHPAEDLFVALAKVGPKAFSGLTGIVRDQEGSDLCNQNFVVVSVTPAAVEAILRDGGLAWIKAEARRAYAALARDSTCVGPLRFGESAEFERILSQTVFREILVYVHPFGVIPLGEILAREMRQDDTPVEAFLYFHGREDAFYLRYREAFLARETGNAAEVPPALPRGVPPPPPPPPLR